MTNTPDELNQAVERLTTASNEAKAALSPSVRWARASYHDIDRLLSDRAELLATVEGMRGALEPFALAADNMDGDEPDSLFIYDSPEAAMISYGDLRQARAVFTNGEEK